MDNNFRREGSTEALPIGYLLHWYELLEVIGRGGYGITYLAMDRNLQRRVAIKEYLPLDFACRDSTDTVHPITKNHRELYDWGLQRFLVEARTLAKFSHPAIIRVVSVFEHNKTAYMVMEYEEGDDLAIHYMENAPLSEERLLDIFVPIIEGLSMVHEANFIHRDIKPSNIYVRSDGSSVLLDFGSARTTIGSRTRALTSLVTAGYAPFEQYNESDDAQGAWTDIYGLGATMYFCVTGTKPADAMERGGALLRKKHDIYQPLSYMTDLPYSDTLKLAIDHALMFHVEDRPATALEWAQMLTGQVSLPPLPMEQVDTVSNTTPYTPENVKSERPVTGPATQMYTPERPVVDRPISQRNADLQKIVEHVEGDEDDEDDSTRIDYRPRHVTQQPMTQAPDPQPIQQAVQPPVQQTIQPHTQSPRYTAPPTTSTPGYVEDEEPDLTYLVKPKSRPAATQSAAHHTQQTTHTSSMATAAAQFSAQAGNQQSGVAMQQKMQEVFGALGHSIGTILHNLTQTTKAITQQIIIFCQPRKKLLAVSGGGIVALVLLITLIVSFTGGEKTQPGKVLTVQSEQNSTLTAQASADSQDNAAAQPGAPQANSHKQEIQQATHELIQSLIAQAKIDVANNQIVEPEKNNAVYRYQRVLAIQPDNQEAKYELAALASRYVDVVKNSIDEGDWSNAQQQVKELQQMTDDQQLIKPLVAKLDEHDKQLKVIADSLDLGDKYLKQNRLTFPKSSSALFYYTKVLALDPENQHATEGVNQVVAKMSDIMKSQIKSGHYSDAEKTFNRIEAIDPNAESLKEAEGHFAAANKKRKAVGRLVAEADHDFVRGNLIGSNSAYSKYREALKMSRNNKQAMSGLKHIYDYFLAKYNQYLNATQFDKAENVLDELKKIDYSNKQLAVLKRNIDDEKLAIKNEPETIKLMLSQLQNKIKKKDMSAIAEMSLFNDKDKKSLKDLFSKYSTFSVKVMQTDHDLGSHRANAKINITNLVDAFGDTWPTDKKAIKFDVEVARDQKKQWKIKW